MFAVESLTAGVKQGETSDDSNETRQGEYTMKKQLIVLGAGGKMGFRVSRKLWTSEMCIRDRCEGFVKSPFFVWINLTKD